LQATDTWARSLQARVYQYEVELAQATQDYILLEV
jgi:hypothetical protein